VPVSEQGVYSIGALARMLGVSPTTLRSWEDRYAVVVPERSSGSQRLYSRQQLDQLQFVCRQMESGLSAADAHRVLAERLVSNPTFTMADRGEPAERTVVVVERDPYGAELAEYLLRTEGYDVHLVRSGADAEQVVAAQGVDLAIVDLMIDRGAGLQLCERLSGTTSVLAVSALDQQDRAIAAGAQAFIRKPLDPLALVSAVRDLIGTSAIVRTARRAPQG
jgi:CheY-like chemotaxis protein